MNNIYYLHLRTQIEPQAAIAPYGKKYALGQWVVVETDKGDEIGKIYYIDGNKKEQVILKIKRSIEVEDLERIKKIKKLEKEYFRTCLEKIKKHKLQMKLIACTLSFDTKHLIFYFISEGRVDFRALIKDLVSSFHKLIRLQQIGPRDETKFRGDYGPCGQPVCCRRFLVNLPSISMDSARLQNLDTITSSKISGSCGKLLCCLLFEEEEYKKLKKNLPNIGEKVMTESGDGRVVSQNILEQKILLELEKGGMVEVSLKNK